MFVSKAMLESHYLICKTMEGKKSSFKSPHIACKYIAHDSLAQQECFAIQSATTNAKN